jgi:biopolymer transport protein ExbD
MAVGTGGVKSEPNVVPMIDVMLVLLIIFMVTIPMLAAGFTAQPPQGINLKSHPEDPADIVLGIDRNGLYYLDKRPISLDTLGETLQRIYANRDEHVMYVKADKDLEYAKVLEVMDIAAHNGVRVVGAISEQEPGTSSTVPGDQPDETKKP